VNAFHYRDGRLFAEEVPLDDLARRVGTPLYVYSAGAIRARYRAWREAFRDLPVLFCYAVKANPNLAVLRLLSGLGAGADTVSGGEIERALEAGIAPNRIVYSGVGKSDAELRLALEVGIRQINVESREELRRLSELATAAGRTAAIAIRVNPDIDAETHDKITTARLRDKFGIPYSEAFEAYDEASRLPGIRAVGLHLHLGSQITAMGPFARACRFALELLRELRRRGHPLRHLDLGGGFGIAYRPGEQRFDPVPLAALLGELTAELDVELLIEPGRIFVGEAGVLLARVIGRKETPEKRFLVLDAGMQTLLRPALYDAWHEILPVRCDPRAERERVEVVGPICESGDVLGRDRLLPRLQRDDLVAITCAGAYGATMASDYNSRPRAAEVLVDGRRWAIIKPRREAREQFADERVPDWLETVPLQAGA